MIRVSFDLADPAAAGSSFGRLSFLGDNTAYAARGMLVLSVVLLLDRFQAWSSTKASILDFEPVDSRNWLKFERKGKSVLIFGDGRLVDSAQIGEILTELRRAATNLWRACERNASTSDSAVRDLECLLREHGSLP